MVQDERAQFAAVKKLMLNGEFDEALAQLQAIGGPKAESWIAEIHKRQPLKSDLPPMPVDDFTQAERLIGQKKFDEAVALLQASEHKSAAELLKKIEEARSAERKTSSAERMSWRKSILTRLNRVLK